MAHRYRPGPGEDTVEDRTGKVDLALRFEWRVVEEIVGLPRTRVPGAGCNRIQPHQKGIKDHSQFNALDDLARIVTPSDNLLIFYAGHGWWDEKSNIGYWLPADASKDSKAEWFRNSTLCDYLKEINSKHTLLIADACFAGGIFKTRKAFPDAPVAINKLYELPSRKAMTSGTLTEVPDRSAFIRFLVERLENNKEKYLSSEQLFSSFRIAVINNSDVVPQYGEIQGVGDEGGDFIFIRKQITQK